MNEMPFDRVIVTPLDRSAPIYVAGHRGLVGSAIWRHLHTEGFTDVIGRSSTELDLRDRRAVFAFFAERPISAVILAAARVGGILANNTYPVDFISDNLRIQVNVLDAARECGVRRLLFLGSSCIYPKFAPQPIKEECLFTGPLETTNEAYAIAKITGIIQIQAVRRQYGLPWISLMPTNLYGPGDNFAADGSHVVPALIRRFESAKLAGDPVVTNWGTGTPRRELLHVDDLARACLHLLDNYDGPEQLNVGTGEDTTIAEISGMVAQAVGYHGRIEWDTSKPDGTPRKLLDISKIKATGWSPQIGLSAGIADTVSWYRRYRDSARM
jgi:GDP-L-fucose synthase